MQPLYLPHWRDKMQVSSQGPVPSIVLENEKLKVIIGTVDAGQQIPHHPEGLAVYHFLEGSGWMTVDEARYPVQPGAIVITPEGARRGVTAEARIVFLAVRIS
jgi:quercetin dioxygenase-like cupin family protein